MASEGEIVKKLEDIEGHLKELKEGVLGETPTLVSIEAHLTKQDKAIVEIKKGAGIQNWIAFIAFMGAVAFLGVGLLIGNKLWSTTASWDYSFVIALGIVGVCFGVSQIRKIN